MDEAPLAINGWDGSLYENILKLCWNSSFPFSINSSSFYPFFSPTGVNDRHTVVILTSSSLPLTWRSSPLPPPPPKKCHFCPQWGVGASVSSCIWCYPAGGRGGSQVIGRGEAAGTSLHAILGPARTPGLPAGASPLHWHIEKTQWQKDKDKDKCQYKDRDKEKDKRVLNPFHWVRFWAQEDFRYACQPQTSIDTSRSQQKHINKVFSFLATVGLNTPHRD